MTIDQYGRLDGLLNSAYRAGDFKEICDSDFNDWQETMNTNFFGTMNLTMAAVKKMESNAAIVMINSLNYQKAPANTRRLCSIKRCFSHSNQNTCKRTGAKRH